MTYSQLKAFHALALERSFHGAANRLSLTQPAVSIQIRNLEQDSARILFRRSGHAVDLTEDGLALFAVTTQMFEAETKAQNLLSATAQDIHSTIHLGSDGPHVALDLIAAVRKHHPNIRFRVTLANADTTKENLLSLKIDAAVMANIKSDSRMIAQTISTQSLIALVPHTHELSDRQQVSLEELAAYPLVFREYGSNTQRIVDNAFTKRRLNVSAELVMGSREGVIEAVARGLGIGFVFDREISQDSRCHGVRVEGFKGSNSDMLLCLREQQYTPLMKSLFNTAEQLTT